MRVRFKLCYITGRVSLRNRALPSLLEEAVELGIDLIQIREKDLETRALIDLAEPAIRRARGTASSVVINDRLDVAVALGAAGVHLGNHSLPVQTVRDIAPRNFLVGSSCHSLEEAQAAESAGADYILLGPIFETPSKLAYGAPLGLDRLQEVAARVKIPVLALGGITVERVKPCLKNGASGIAGIRLFQEAPSLAARVAGLRDLFNG